MTQLNIATLVKKLPQKFQPQHAGDMHSVFQFTVLDTDSFYLQISQGQCSCQFGEHPDPSVTLEMDEATLLRVMTGEQDGMSAYLKGQLRASGNIILATQLGKLFQR